MEVQSSPLSAGTSLRSVLWDRCFGAVVSSATLSSTDGFGRFAEAAGIPDNARYLVVPSSFAYEEVAQLVVPKLRSDPSQSEAHAGEIAELLPGLIREDEGTLVIFTSWRQLGQVCAAPAALLKRVLSQATESKGRILAEHQRRIDGGEGSVIFGLASFAEGIDLPGAYCRHVIICKLPFRPGRSRGGGHGGMAQRSAAQPLYGNVRARCGAAPQAGLRAAFALGKGLRPHHPAR